MHYYDGGDRASIHYLQNSGLFEDAHTAMLIFKVHLFIAYASLIRNITAIFKAFHPCLSKPSKVLLKPINA